jgi:D-alanyl-D-alanine carboxypeptidase (penicillin-binding protein 5/6)
MRWMPVLALLVVIAYSLLAIIRVPALELQPSIDFPATGSTSARPLSWPGYGQAAVGAVGYGVLTTNGSQTPVPTASTAKIMVALSVLRVKPLEAGQTNSPIITMTQRDVDIYNACLAKDCSVALVANGEKISEYQALQALLLPSANNIADSLAIWAFGSTENYVAYANKLAAELGMNDTRITDASGFSPQTVSSARDLITLSLEALKNPVFAEIVSQPSAIIPVAGKIYNTNGLLGRHGIIGLKTGNTEEAGGVFVAAAKHVVNGQTITVVASVMGGPNLTQAMLDSLPLLASAKQNFNVATVIPKGTPVGSYQTPWGDTVGLHTARDLNLLVWNGAAVSTTHTIQPLQLPTNAQTPVGTISATSAGASGSTPIITDAAIDKPSLQWRLTHPW